MIVTAQDMLRQITSVVRALRDVSRTKGSPEYFNNYLKWRELLKRSIRHALDAVSDIKLHYTSRDSIAGLIHPLTSLLRETVEALFSKQVASKDADPKLLDSIYAVTHKAQRNLISLIQTVEKSEDNAALWINSLVVIKEIERFWSLLEETVIKQSNGNDWVKTMHTVVANKRVTASPTIWLCHGSKGGTQGPSANKALADYIAKYGKRGNIRLYENIDNGEFLTFVMGCKSYKGTVKEVAQQILETKAALVAAGASTHASTGSQVFKSGDPVIVTYGKNKVLYGVIVKKVRTESNPASWVSVKLPSGAIEDIPVHDVKHVETAQQITAAEPLPNRVAGQIIGDLKRIRSTVKAWKGKMEDAEYKHFVAYESAVGDFIGRKFIPKMSKEYQQKAKEL